MSASTGTESSVAGRLSRPAVRTRQRDWSITRDERARLTTILPASVKKHVKECTGSKSNARSMRQSRPLEWPERRLASGCIINDAFPQHFFERGRTN
jgi:hypothetical protein